MSKSRAKKRFNSNVNVIDIQTYSPPAQKNRRVVLNPRNQNQELYLQKIQNPKKSIVFAVGPAGTGKSFLAVLHGIKLLQEGVIDKIVVTRPAVSVDEDLGFLPGTINEKMAPWTRPIFDVFEEYYRASEVADMLAEGIIEIAPLAMMRGRTFKNAYIIADECQLCTPNQMKMLLTRIGENSRMVVTGDLAQADRGADNGLRDFLTKLEGKRLMHLDVVRFDKQDIERHDAVREVLNLYGDE